MVKPVRSRLYGHGRVVTPAKFLKIELINRLGYNLE